MSCVLSLRSDPSSIPFAINGRRRVSCREAPFRNIRLRKLDISPSASRDLRAAVENGLAALTGNDRVVYEHGGADKDNDECDANPSIYDYHPYVARIHHPECGDYFKYDCISNNPLHATWRSESSQASNGFAGKTCFEDKT